MQTFFSKFQQNMQPYHIPRLHGAKVSVSQIDCNLNRYLDRNPEDAPVYMGHSLFNTTKRVILLFSHSYIVIHLISGLKLSTSRFRLSVYKISQSRSRSRQNLLCVNRVIVLAQVWLRPLTWLYLDGAASVESAPGCGRCLLAGWSGSAMSVSVPVSDSCRLSNCPASHT